MPSVRRSPPNSAASAGKNICRSSSKDPRSPAQSDRHLQARSLRPCRARQDQHRDVEIYSACLAVENMWLTARAEGVGMGWVSILRNDALRRNFGIPADVIPIAYLCVGYVREFPDRPILASKDWAQRLPPRSLIHFDRGTTLKTEPSPPQNRC